MRQSAAARNERNASTDRDATTDRERVKANRDVAESRF